MSGSGFFGSSDYFTLLGDMAAVKHEEVIDVQEFVLMPGEVRVIRRRAESATRFVGVVAGYRKALAGGWRALASVPPPHLAGRLWSATISPEKKYRVVVGVEQLALEEVGR